MYLKQFFTSVGGALLLGGVLLANPSYAETPVAADAPGQPKEVSFKKRPKIDFENADLKGKERHIAVKVVIDEQGKVSSAEVVQSTGLPALDKKIIYATMQAEFTPYIENGKAIACYTVLDFALNLWD